MDLKKEEKAILDMIAYAEGTLGCSQNGYDILNDFHLLTGWTPETTMQHGGNKWKSTTTASGRYQFLDTTWSFIHGSNVAFNKANQDKGAIKLINNALKSTKNESRSVSIIDIVNRDKFIVFLNKISPTWASIPDEKHQFKSYYGQSPSNFTTVDKLHNIYLTALKLYS